jgi:4-amino-4-deoxy-L-arabinose transferase-like glycosyltransferase
VFFSLSQSKRPQYLLPLIPAIALLVAALWSRQPAEPRGARQAAVALALLGAFLLLGSGALVAVIRGMTPEVAAVIPGTARLLGAACVGGALLAWWASRHSRLELTLGGLALPVVLIPFVSGGLMREVGRDRSSREMALAILAVASPDTEIVGVQAYPLSLPFYMRRELTLATDDARELTSNYLPRTVGHWLRLTGTPLRPTEWWREAALICDRPRVFVIRASNQPARAWLEPRLPLVAHSRKYAAYGPCGQTDLAE